MRFACRELWSDVLLHAQLVNSGVQEFNLSQKYSQEILSWGIFLSKSEFLRVAQQSDSNTKVKNFCFLQVNRKENETKQGLFATEGKFVDNWWTTSRTWTIKEDYVYHNASMWTHMGGFQLDFWTHGLGTGFFPFAFEGMSQSKLAGTRISGFTGVAKRILDDSSILWCQKVSAKFLQSTQRNLDRTCQLTRRNAPWLHKDAWLIPRFLDNFASQRHCTYSKQQKNFLWSQPMSFYQVNHAESQPVSPQKRCRFWTRDDRVSLLRLSL